MDQMSQQNEEKKKVDEGGLAFPFNLPNSVFKNAEGTWMEKQNIEKGLTKREWFAGLAMQGMIAGSQGLQITVKEFASQSIKLADALIAKLKEKP